MTISADIPVLKFAQADLPAHAMKPAQTWNPMSGEWSDTEDFHEPLPEADPYWAIAQIALAVCSWGCAFLAWAYVAMEQIP